jgi:tRNA dimethylallyltransferase
MRKIIAVCGPTAVGKTKYAIEAAKAFGGEVVSCDSMQLYKYMDIGSAKPTAEELSQVPHHLVDLIDPADAFSVAEYQKLAREAIEDIFARGKVPVIAGGTGLYLNSILYDMDFSNAKQDQNLRLQLEKEAEEFGPEYLHNKLRELDSEAASRIHPNNIKKVVRAIEGALSGDNIKDFKECNTKVKDFERILIGLTRDRDELYDRINLRVDLLVEQEFINWE